MNTDPQNNFDLSFDFFEQAVSRRDLLVKLNETLLVAIGFVKDQDIIDGSKNQKVEHLKFLHENISQGFENAGDHLELSPIDLQLADYFLMRSKDVCNRSDQEWTVHVDSGGTSPLDEFQKAQFRKILENKFEAFGKRFLSNQYDQVESGDLRFFMKNVEPFITAQVETLTKAEYKAMNDPDGSFNLDQNEI